MLGELYRSLSRVASLHNTGKLMFRDGGNYMTIILGKLPDITVQAIYRPEKLVTGNTGAW